jgi:predicted dienelactone hydrolase
MLPDMAADDYDPFLAGPFAVGVRTLEVGDRLRNRVFPCEIWYPAASPASASGRSEERNVPAQPGDHPLVVFSHFSGGGRRSATYLTTHLASHGYAVAALDHSELVAPELGPRPGESAPDRARRIDAVMASRVPDVRLLLSALNGPPPLAGLDGIGLDPELIAVAGHSFGGWTALAAPESEPRVRAVVALAPGGSSRPVPGVLPLTLAFGWKTVVPVLILTGDRDVPVPLSGVQDIFERAPEPKRMFVLHGADHEHFADDAETSHEAVRAMTLPGDAAWMTSAMLPMSDLCPGAHGHAFARGLALAHLDAVLRGSEAATQFLARSAVSALADRGVRASSFPSEGPGTPGR